MSSILSPFYYVDGFEGTTHPAPEFSQLAPTYTAPKAVFSRRPSEILVENSNVRPDVARVAILGYN